MTKRLRAHAGPDTQIKELINLLLFVRVSEVAESQSFGPAIGCFATAAQIYLL
jgi:hypothetical protein